MQSTACFKFKKSHQLTSVLQALGDHKSKQLKILTKEKNAVNIPEIFKLFSPVLTKILAPQTLNQETVIIVPDISTKAIIKLYELVLTGYVIQSNHEDRCNDIISEIIDIAKLFDIKINPTAILSGKKDCLGSDVNTSESEYSEIPTPLLNPDCLENEVKVKDLVKEEVKLHLVSYKDEYDVDRKENVFEASNSLSTDGNHNDNSYIYNNIGVNSSLAKPIVSSSKDLVTAVKSVQDIELKTEIEETIESVQSVFYNDENESHEVSTTHFDVDTVSLNRFDLKLKRVSTVEKIKFSCKICQYQTNSKSKLKNHALTEHQVVKIFCSICKFQTDGKKYLKQHIKTQHENVRYFCKSCSYQSKTRDLLKQHIQAEHEGVRYPCESCSYQAKYRKNLKEHVLGEHKGVRYSCEHCDYQSKRANYVKYHVQRVHVGVKLR